MQTQASPPTQASSAPPPRRALLSPTITAALCACGIVAAGLAGAGWWTLSAQHQEQAQAREQTLRASAQFLGLAAEQMIASGELTPLRTLIAGAAGSNQFRSIRIHLADTSDTTIAESNPASGTVYPKLPDVWPPAAGAQETQVERTRDGRAAISTPLSVPGKGAAVLEIEDGVRTSMWSDWRTQLGLGGMASAGLLAMIGFTVRIRNRFRALEAIRESLGAMRAGDNDPRVLAVSPTLGPEAEQWNAMLGERAEIMARQARSGAETKLGDRRTRDGDLLGVCDAMWQGIVLVDEKQKIKFVNGAAAVFLRGKREDMVGKDISGYITEPRVLEAVKSLASGSGRGRPVVELELDKDPSGRPQSVFRYSMRPVRKEDHASAVVVIEDITQQRVAEDARHAFVASATHELRTPLTNMRLYIDSLLEDPNLDIQKRTQAVNVLSQESRRLESIVSDMLSVAQIESGAIKLNRGDVRLEPIFEELKNDFAEQAREKDIKLRFELPPKWPLMEGDRDKIVMALHNLVGNAMKYTPAGGDVVVRVAPGGTEGKTFTVEVVDTGIGIKEDEQSLVFEKFYRAKDKRIEKITGTGLGLSIAREVVRLHGGDIALKSQLDKGSTFTLTLPAKAA